MTAELVLSSEDRQRIHEEAQAVLQRVLNDEPRPKLVKAARPSRSKDAPSRRGANLINHPPKYDRDQVVQMYRDGKTVKEISQELGANRATVHRALRERDITPPSKKGGAQRKEYCGKGIHLMKEHGRELKDGGRYCVPCRAETSARNHQRRKAQK